ncbi:helix-turn-helix domain-containing protein [Halorarum salinum]|uniref:Helix-turn-helix domain-containing protein n=1 Tax=Halorarum salinum TaxID=2743089 RepID=A0A7D5LDJ2_9EURY|nr:helix-turn-helix domain-containing protein [Halobaculum salinum]QLG64131.1 helix-turn-helix domain-containing protein [Halobaculum salinum]
MYEATFELQGEGLVAELSREFSADIQLWCNDHSDLLYVRSERVASFRDELSGAVGIQESIRQGNQLVVVTDHCLRKEEQTLVETHLADNGCLSLPPLIYENGTKRSKVLALDPASLTAVYEGLRDDGAVTVRAKREIKGLHPDVPVLGLDDVFPRLSDRQFETFRVACDSGYYEVPRGTTTEEIGERLGIDRRTAEYHLRRAENKIAASLADHLTLLQ